PPGCPVSSCLTPLACVSSTSALAWTSAPSLHDALPISRSVDGYTLAVLVISAVFSLPVLRKMRDFAKRSGERVERNLELASSRLDRKSTRLNSSHVSISYAVFCLRKKRSRCWAGPAGLT